MESLDPPPDVGQLDPTAFVWPPRDCFSCGGTLDLGRVGAYRQVLCTPCALRFEPRLAPRPPVAPKRRGPRTKITAENASTIAAELNGIRLGLQYQGLPADIPDVAEVIGISERALEIRVGKLRKLAHPWPKYPAKAWGN